ncbi:hypothetical protein CIG75_19275 [Tumebacillus algifaecis]|uniref:Uncharacterized protein n=1 Tax=Tumebacillus algifaecis TaxID=1214604 RepID=A0A223D637_9BACL|nr:hypothetical protein [Tumebacillus algifaecis]ASS76876.1 hypothetical protein CIG75_19275 [Tumebacillus algifaecis]
MITHLDRIIAANAEWLEKNADHADYPKVAQATAQIAELARGIEKTADGTAVCEDTEGDLVLEIVDEMRIAKELLLFGAERKYLQQSFSGALNILLQRLSLSS